MKKVIKALNEYKSMETKSLFENHDNYAFVFKLIGQIISKLKYAKICISEKNISAKCESMLFAISTLEVFRNSLDEKVDNKVFEELNLFYTYVIKNLTIANIDNDVLILEKMINLLSAFKASLIKTVDKI